MIRNCSRCGPPKNAVHGTMRRCTKCGSDGPFTKSTSKKRAKDGLRSVCKPCENASVKARYALDPAKFKAISVAWQERNQDKVLRIRRRRILRSYGLSEDRFDALMIHQAGRCAVCRSAHLSTTTRRGVCIDHDHGTGLVRGLLCSKCNLALGHFRDDPANLERGAIYLRSHMAPKNVDTVPQTTGEVTPIKSAFAGPLEGVPSGHWVASSLVNAGPRSAPAPA